jgi:hypothetical protein
MRREQQRNGPYPFRHLALFISTRPSVFFVAFLSVLCVKFRKAQPKMHSPCKHFGGLVVQVPNPSRLFARKPLPLNLFRSVERIE